MEVTILAANLFNNLNLGKPMHSNEWRISETNLVPTSSVICRVKFL
jgi:hypothetical protein